MQILKEEDQDAHWQCDMKVQDLKKHAAEKRRVEEFGGGYAEVIGEGSKELQGKDRSGVRWLSSKVPLDLAKETRGKVVEFLGEVLQCGRWPQHACTRMFFLSPKNVTTERPIALMPAMVRWWEALRAPERFEWDTTDGRNGGVERTVWETLDGKIHLPCR